MSDSFSRYDVYAVAGSLYCYKDTNVLRNHFGLQDSMRLRVIEAEISAARQSEMLESPVSGRFSTAHLCRIHRGLFGDVYPFAGHLRYEDIAKGETRFLAHHQIREKLFHLLDELRKERFLDGADRDYLVQRSAYYMAELNYIHPFREGNGRAIREFMRLLFLRQGYSVDWSAVPVDHLLQAMIDSVYDTEPLTQVLSQCLK